MFYFLLACSVILIIVIFIAKADPPTNDKVFQKPFKPDIKKPFLSNTFEGIKTEEENKKQLIDQKRKDFRIKFEKGFLKQTDDDYPRYVFIDFETTDLPLDYKLPTIQNLPLSPYIVQAAVLVFNEKAELIDEFNSIIKVPDNAVFAPGAVRLHKITKQRSLTEGKDISEMLYFIQKYIGGNTVVVAHNIQFDNLMLYIEAKRNKIKIPKYTKYCTMKETVDLVKVWKHNYSGYKYPKLKELVEYTFFGGESVKNATNFHDAYTDIKLCALCFFELKLYEDLVECD